MEAPGNHLEGAYYASRSELLQWVNSLLQTDYTKIEQCSNGVPYLKLLPSLFGNVSGIVSKGKMTAKTEYEATANFKLIQEAFNKNGITKVIDIERVARGNVQANLECMQWFKRLCDVNGVTPETVVPVAKAAAPAGTAGKKALLGTSGRRPVTPSTRAGPGTPNASTRGYTSATGSAASSSRRPASAQGSLNSSALMIADEAFNTPQSTTRSDAAQQQADMERRFYYDKLRDIENLVSNELRVAQMSSSQLASEVKRLLYATYESTTPGGNGTSPAPKTNVG